MYPMRVSRNPELLPHEKAIIDFAKRTYRYPGKQEQDMKDELGMNATTFWRKLNDLLDRPEALAYDPSTVNRYRRIRSNKLAARSARSV